MWFGEDSVSKQAALSRTVDEEQRRARLTQIAARAGADRSDRASADRPRKRRRCRTPRSAFPARISRRVISRSSSLVSRRRRSRSSISPARAATCCPVLAAPEPRHHHRDQELVRAQRVALRAVFRRRAEQKMSPTRTRTAASRCSRRSGTRSSRRSASTRTTRACRRSMRSSTTWARRTGVAEPDGKTGQGVLARRFFLDGGYARGRGERSAACRAVQGQIRHRRPDRSASNEEVSDDCRRVR